MVFEPLFTEKPYRFKTPALGRLYNRLVILDDMYDRDDQYKLWDNQNHNKNNKVGQFPLTHRIRMALLIIVGP